MEYRVIMNEDKKRNLNVWVDNIKHKECYCDCMELQKKERGFLHNGFRACSDLFCGYFGLFCGESVKDARKAYALCLSDHGDGTVLAGKQNQKI